jgi:hypothetical protein
MNVTNDSSEWMNIDCRVNIWAFFYFVKGGADISMNVFWDFDIIVEGNNVIQSNYLLCCA